MTYGNLKLRMSQMFPSVSLDIIEGFIEDRYEEILGELPWSHEDVQSILVTVAPYVTGTVSVTLGSNAITLSGGAWTTAMTGQAFRVPGRDEYYEFTYASPTTGTLDRPFEGPTATGAAYSISQHVYPLPSDCRILADDAFSSMTRTTHGELNLSDQWRVQVGTPYAWASYMDGNSVPPFMQVELYPVPNLAVGIPFTYSADLPALGDTSLAIAPWIQPGALVQGVIALLKGYLRDYTGAQLAAVSAAAALKQMRGSEAQGMAPGQMRLDSYYVGYRTRRWNR